MIERENCDENFAQREAEGNVSKAILAREHTPIPQKKPVRKLRNVKKLPRQESMMLVLSRRRPPPSPPGALEGPAITMDSGADCETEEESAPSETCVSPEGLPLPSNSREQRNRAEKNRRDKLNSFISDLATMVPQVARSAKRLDKTSVLRITAGDLRVVEFIIKPMRIRLKRQKENREPPTFPTWLRVDSHVMDDMAREQLSGFVTVMSNTGKLILLSPSVENLLGHTNVDLVGHNIYHILAPEDHEPMRRCLEKVYYSAGADIQVRIRRAGPRTESPIYEICHIRIVNSGLLNLLDDEAPNYEDSSGREIAHATALPHRTYTCFVRVFKHEVNNRVISIVTEYVTRHLIDGRIINCDQRISCIAGYLTEEVSGLSAFKFMHRDDVRWVMIALRQMYDRGDSRGTSCYRLMSRTGRFIYLRTSGYLEVDKDGIVESFVCINQAVCETEGLKLIAEMKRKFSANLNVVSESEESSVESVEDPEYVEAAVIHLITNLPSPGSDHRSTPSPRHASLSENQDCSSTTTESIIKPYHIQIKTAPKRPPSTDQDANLYKRQRTSPQSLSPIPSTSSASPYDMMPHSSSSQIMEIPELDLDEQPTQSEQSLYQHDQLLHHHV